MTRTKKGFTLVEMLIVIAIIAILIAIAIPTFSAQLEKARVATDLANERAAKSLAVAHYLLNAEKLDADTSYVYLVGSDAQSNLTVYCEDAEDDIAGSGTAAATTIVADGELVGLSKAVKNTDLTITVKDGVVSASTFNVLH